MRIGYLMQEGGPDVRQKPLSGPANHVWQTFRGLQDRGHTLRLVTRYDGQIWSSDDLETFVPVTVHKIDQGWRRRIESMVRRIQSTLHLPYFSYFESKRFAEACIQELPEFDIYYERMGWMGYGGGAAARKARIPLVLEVNNGDFITELERLGKAPRGLQRWIAIELMRRSIKQAAHIVASGDGHRERFIEWWGIDPHDVSVVENGSELVNILDRGQLKSFKQRDRSDDSISIVFVGAFEPWHGVSILLPAIAKLVSRIPSIKLTLIGSGSEHDSILGLIQELELDPFVEMTGRLDIREVAEHLSYADIGVAPYCGWMEFSGLKLFDYKAAGLPIVASGRDGQPSVIRHGQSGWIVPPCDVDALSDALVFLVEETELRRNIGRTARIEAENCHSWEHTAENLELVINQYVVS